MTFSIVARSADGTRYGVAMASKFLAVGAYVPAATAVPPGPGALATQSWSNVSYKADGLALLAEGYSATDVIARLVAADAEPTKRQLGVVDSHGGAATYTGSACLEWAGGAVELDAPAGVCAVQGNILAGPQVVDAMLSEWRSAAPERPLARSLLAALAAGDAAGGDRRGKQSAALLVVSVGAGYGGSDVEVDLRSDDHSDPIPDLARLLDLHQLYFGNTAPERLRPITAELAAEIARLLERSGYAPVDGSRGAVAASLARWAGAENLEERLGGLADGDGAIDPLVLGMLRAKRNEL